MNSELREKVERTNAYACLECGKCTSICPVSLLRRNSTTDKQYSPRILLTKAIRQKYESLFYDYDLWSCLTCKKCDEYCPAGIHYIELMQFLREGASRSGFDGKCSHSGALQSLSRIMTSDNLQQNRLAWLSNDLKTSEKGDVLYFVGCAPYFDVFFTDLHLSTLDAAKSSIKILNKLGISPVLLPNERCCGHDLLWNGDVDQDPCRLGRHLGIYDEPRQVLQHNAAQPAEGAGHFHDMKETGKRSLCCGVSAWMNCDLTSKTMQVERLRQARETGADTLAVACPKCQIHLTCAMKDQAVGEKFGIRIRDIAAITLERME